MKSGQYNLPVGIAEQVLADIDAIEIPTEDAPIVNFSTQSWTAPGPKLAPVHNVLDDDALADLEADIAQNEASERYAVLDQVLADFDLEEDIVPDAPAPTDDEIAENLARQMRKQTEKARIAKDAGPYVEKAIKNHLVDLDRAGPGKPAYLETRREKREAKAKDEGRTFKPRNSKPTPEDKNQQHATAQKLYKANRTPAQIEKDREADRLRKQNARERERLAKVAAILDGKTIF